MVSSLLNVTHLPIGPRRVQLRLGTRASELALAQSRQVAASLQQAWPELSVELVTFTTKGDRDRTSSLQTFGGQGAFTAEIEAALKQGDIAFAVHSLKDLPTEGDPALTLVAPPLRADARDCLVGNASLSELPAGARVGTGSERRTAQLRRLRPDLEWLPIRGNITSRVAKLRAGAYDALILAMAGIERLGQERLGLEAHELHPLTPEECLPAAGQGALAIQCRADDVTTQNILAAIAHRPTAQAVEAERTFLQAMGLGCHSPLGVWADIHGEQLTLRIRWFAPEPQGIIEAEYHGLAGVAAEAGRALAATLLSKRPCPTTPQLDDNMAQGPDTAENNGAGSTSIPKLCQRALAGQRIVITRDHALLGDIEDTLLHLGAEIAVQPSLTIEPLPFSTAILQRLPTFHWLLFTSANAVRAFFSACPSATTIIKDARVNSATLDNTPSDPRVESSASHNETEPAAATEPAHCQIGCVGAVTAAALQTFGLEPDLVASRETGADLGHAVAQRASVQNSPQVLYLKAETTAGQLEAELDKANIPWEGLNIYRSVPLTELTSEAYQTLEQWHAIPKASTFGQSATTPSRENRIVVLAGSPATITAFSRAAARHMLLPQRMTVMAIGPSTAAAAAALGYERVWTASKRTMIGMIEELIRRTLERDSCC